MPRKSRYTLVVCSCDAYQDAWDPLFILLRRYWPTFDAPIVLNTETLSYQHEGLSILCPQLYNGYPTPRSVPWSKRLRETLSRCVDTDLVLLYLDDFYLRSPVNTQRLETCLSLMLTRPDVACVSLLSCPPGYEPTTEHPWLVRRSKRAPYLLNLQAGLWRKSRLLHFLRDHESPWYFERWGSLRARRYPDEFYAAVAVDGKEAIFDYSPVLHGLTGGRWRPDTVVLFRREQIPLDLSIRGVMPAGWKAPRRRRNWFKSAWNIWRSLRP